MNRSHLKRVAISLAIFWCLTLGIYIERSVDSQPATNDAGSSLRLVAQGESDLYINAYVQMPTSTRLGVPYLLHYTGPTRPYGLAVVFFTPASSTNDRVVISAVTVVANGRSTTHAINETDALTAFETTHGPTLTGTIHCGAVIPDTGTIKLDVRGTRYSGADGEEFSQVLSFAVRPTTYVYPGWCFVFLPMSA